jgi:cob(I)alamin adenosyltransferase
MMTQSDSAHTVPPVACFEMAEFDAVAASRPVAEVLRANLEDAEAQLRFERRLARRAERRVNEVAQAVENWRHLIDDYERVAGPVADAHLN